MLLATIVVLSPWMWRSWQVSGSPIFFAEKMQGIIVDGSRYVLPPEPTSATPSSNILRSMPRDALVTNDIEDLQTNFLFVTVTVPIKDWISDFKDRAFLITNHFFHNIITSVLILPTTPGLYDLRATIYEVYPYWNKLDQPWTGDLSALEITGLGINLTLIALGLSVAWRKWQLAGWVPLGIFLAYDVAVALAGTSGGRYIVPIDWFVLLYYAIGLIHLFTWGMRFFGVMPAGEDIQPVNRSFSYRQGLLIMLPFFLFVSAMTMIDRTIPLRYPELSKIEILRRIKQEDFLSQTPYDFQELKDFLLDSGGVAYLGRALYPRFYAPGEGEHEKAYAPRDYPRLVFTLIGNYIDRGVIIKLAQPPIYFPHAVDVIVVGCKDKSNKYRNTIDAIIVVVLDDQEFIYSRLSETPLICPFEAPNS